MKRIVSVESKRCILTHPHPPTHTILKILLENCPA
eukprot:COSAG05_NODE_3985_length_1738_cov_1.787675_1_plen_34_part_10